MDEYLYESSCYMCDTEFSVRVKEVDEFPSFCPMCGAEIEMEMSHIDSA